MSFAQQAKEELCRTRIEKESAAIAECYGIALYCHIFSAERIQISTANRDFAARLPKLLKKAFNLTFDDALGEVKPEKPTSRSVFEISDPKKMKTILQAFGQDPQMLLAHHINFGVLEEDGLAADFIRGAFLAGGTVTDPERGYHLELATSHQSVARETVSILQEMNLSPRISSRGANALVYFKQADAIADFLTVIGASKTAMNVMTAKVEKEMKNTVTRQINCDSANADKTVSAAQEQLAAIRSFAAMAGLNGLPEALQSAALLRIANPEASLSDLARLSNPPVSKSCLSHRLKRIMELVEQAENIKAEKTEDKE